MFLACRDALPCEPVHINSRCEIVANRIQLYDHSHLTICCIYRPPNSDATYLENLCSTMEEVIEKYPRDMIWITGDINLPYVDWENNIVQSSSYPVLLYDIFLDFLSVHSFTQMVNFPTRGNNILDIFAVTDQP